MMGIKFFDFKPPFSSKIRKIGHTAWASPQGVLIIGGAYSEQTTELLNDNGGATPSFTLKNKRE